MSRAAHPRRSQGQGWARLECPRSVPNWLDEGCAHRSGADRASAPDVSRRAFRGGNRGPREIVRRIESGEFGAVLHVEVMICLDILGPGGFADPNAPHPVLTMAGGAIADFLPHLASLAHLFIGSHRQAYAVWSKRQQ